MATMTGSAFVAVGMGKEHLLKEGAWILLGMHVGSRNSQAPVVFGEVSSPHKW